MNQKSNEPVHSFFSDEPENPEYTRGYQDGMNDGYRMGERIGEERGAWMLNQYLKHLHSLIGEATIKDIKETIEAEKREMREKG